MIYGSACSGIEAATMAWGPLGWKAAFFAEIEKFPSAVLKHRYPDVPNAGDFTNIIGTEYGAIDVLVAGTPCQSFSIAGLRGGMADDRGNLALEFLRLIDRIRPTWIVWENVPGVFSSASHDAPDEVLPADDMEADEWEVGKEYEADETSDFGCFLSGLQELGYGFAWASLDAQYRGLAQRRERLFVVGHIRDERAAQAVLFDRTGLFGHSAPSREKGKGITHDVAGSLTGSGSGRGTERTGESRGQDPVVPVSNGMRLSMSRASGFEDGSSLLGGVPNSQPQTETAFRVPNPYNEGEPGNFPSTGDLAHCLNAGAMGRIDYETETMIVAPLNSAAPYGDNPSRESLLVAHSLRGDGFDASEDGTGRGTPLVPVAFDCKRGSEAGELSPTLRSMGHNKTHANAGGQVAIAIQAGSLRENPASGPDGVGVRCDDVAYTLEARSEVQAVAFTQNQEGSVLTGDVMHSIGTNSNATGRNATGRNATGRNATGRNATGRNATGRNATNVAVAFRAAGQEGYCPSSISPPITASDGGGSGVPTVAFDTTQITNPNNRSPAKQGGPCHALSSNAHPPAIMQPMAVRRLTPIECARLQGFPDTFLYIDYKLRKIDAEDARYLLSHGVCCWQEDAQWFTKAPADGPMYKALGNSMAVTVMRLIGERIEAVHAIMLKGELPNE